MSKTLDDTTKAIDANQEEQPDALHKAKSSQSYMQHVDYKTKDLFFLPIPKRLRYNKDDPASLTLVLNILFGLASTFTVANLYYVQPILLDLAENFGLSYSDVANLPILLQAGYATGILLISPCGDLVRRRQLIIGLLVCSIGMTIGLAITNSVYVFQALSFLTGFTTQLPQLLIPLAADLAKPEQRATAISIVMSGLLAGISVARILAGIVAQYTSYKNIYWMSCGMQGFILISLYWFLPDFPAKGKDLTYWHIYSSMAKYAVTEPLLIQGCVIGLLMSAVFVGYWVVMTYLLQGPIYNFNTLETGLFGLIGLAGVCSAPIAGKLIDRLKPWVGQLIGLCICLVSLILYATTAGRSIAALVIGTFLVDCGQPMQQIANASRIASIEPVARGRLNSIFVIFIFIGQIWGTRASTSVFLQHNWPITGALWCGCVGGAILVLFLRGPNEGRKTIFGWKGGANFRKDKPLLAKPEGKPGEAVEESMDLESRGKSEEVRA